MLEFVHEVLLIVMLDRFAVSNIVSEAMSFEKGTHSASTRMISVCVMKGNAKVVMDGCGSRQVMAVRVENARCSQTASECGKHLKRRSVAYAKSSTVEA